MFPYHAWAGKIAGVIALLAFVPYFISTLQGKNRPNRATWFIWLIVGIILFASYRTAGAQDTLWVALANVIIIACIVMLSIKYGEGGFCLFDLVCLTGAALGLLLWWYFASPLPALYLCIGIDFIGAIPTIKKSYLEPQGENHLTWILFCIANTLNLIAVQPWNLAMAAYPIYLFLISTGIVVILSIRLKSKNNSIIQ